MTAPVLARALVAAATPRADYDSVIGDLHEEYQARLVRDGRSRTDLWYWSQALRSLPALLSYSRTVPSFGRRSSAFAIALGVLIAMLLGKDLLDRLIDALSPGGLPVPLYFVLNWALAAVFGAILAAIARRHPVRLALLASTGLVIAFAAPIALELSRALSPAAALLLVGTIPAMSAGAATVRAITTR